MEHDKIDLFCNRSYRTGLIKRARRYVKIRAVRFTRQKRRSVDIVAGSAFCFEEKTRKLLETADRASGRTAYFDGNTSQSRRMATAVHAAGSARLFGLSHSLASAQGMRRLMFALAGVFYCRARLIRRLLHPLIWRRLFACPPVEVFRTGFIYFGRMPSFWK